MIKEKGGCPQVNHPRDVSASISFPVDYTDMIQIFETMEIWNGSHPMLSHTTNGEAMKLWIDLLNQGRYIPATTGSDTHNTRVDDYHDFYQELKSLIKVLKTQQEPLPEALQEVANFLLEVDLMALPLVEKWAKENLGSGGVRTYVHLEQEVNANQILAALKQGKSFLTNGPLLIAHVEGQLPGSTVSREAIKRGMTLQIISNRPLTYLKVVCNGTIIRTNQLVETAALEGGYCYSHTIESLEVTPSSWLVFIAGSDPTNLAMTNPFFIGA